MGFLIMPNGFKVMDEMGIAQKVQKEGMPILRAVMMNEEGRVSNIQSMDCCYSISRPTCIKLLEQTLGYENIQYKKEMNTFHEKDGIVNQLEFKDGTFVNPDVIIASDGMNSKTRKYIFPEFQTKMVAEKEIVSIIYSPELSKNLKHTFVKYLNPERGFNMGILPLGGNELVWYIQINSNIHDLPMKTPSEINAFCSEIFFSLPNLFKRALEYTDYDSTYMWEMNTMDLLPAFHKKGILLMGDAAHPLLSFTSQGTSSALDDAWNLSELLQTKYSSTEALFKTFYEARKYTIQRYILEGKILLDQFLRPHKYSNVALPFVNHVSK